MRNNKVIKKWMISIFLILFSVIYTLPVQATGISITLGDDLLTENTSATLNMVFLITIIALAPSILIMMTAFLRIIVSLHFIRTAMGTQTMPPNQVLVGLALFLTFFVMSPVFSEIKTSAIDPLERAEITQEVAIERGIAPIKSFMLRQARDEDISLFMEMAEIEPYAEGTDVVQEMPLYVLIPAFIIGELRAGFIIGFMIYIPFIIIDMVVAATLMSMGMMMLPPAMISLPFKVLLFVLVDGWNLLIGQIIQTFW